MRGPAAASFDEMGYGLAFGNCHNGEILDLNKYGYPYGDLVGNGPSSIRWNDRISSYITTGRLAPVSGVRGRGRRRGSSGSQRSNRPDLLRDYAPACVAAAVQLRYTRYPLPHRWTN